MSVDDRIKRGMELHLSAGRTQAFLNGAEGAFRAALVNTDLLAPKVEDPFLRHDGPSAGHAGLKTSLIIDDTIILEREYILDAALKVQAPVAAGSEQDRQGGTTSAYVPARQVIQHLNHRDVILRPGPERRITLIGGSVSDHPGSLPSDRDAIAKAQRIFQVPALLDDLVALHCALYGEHRESLIVPTEYSCFAATALTFLPTDIRDSRLFCSRTDKTNFTVGDAVDGIFLGNQSVLSHLRGKKLFAEICRPRIFSNLLSFAVMHKIVRDLSDEYTQVIDDLMVIQMNDQHSQAFRASAGLAMTYLSHYLAQAGLLLSAIWQAVARITFADGNLRFRSFLAESGTYAVTLSGYVLLLLGARQEFGAIRSLANSDPGNPLKPVLKTLEVLYPTSNDVIN